MTHSWIGRISRGLVLLALAFGSTTSGAAQTGEMTLTLPYIVQNYQFGVGEVHGTVRAMVGNQPIDGAEVCANGLCTLTNEAGDYTLPGVNAADVRMFARAATFLPEVVALTVQTGQVYTQDFLLLADLGAQNLQKQILLFWRPETKFPVGCTGGNAEGCYDNDLDAYLWIYSKLKAVLVNLDNRGDCFLFPYACLQGEVWWGTGPEVISFPSLSNNIGNIFHYAVVNYYWQRPGFPPLTQSQARVVVRDVDGSQQVIEVPTTGEGPMWYVFEMDWHGVVTPTNCIIPFQNDPNVPPSCP